MYYVHQEQKYEAPAPITAPIYGVPQPDQGPPGAPNYAYNPQQTYQPPQQQQQQQQQPVSSELANSHCHQDELDLQSGYSDSVHLLHPQSCRLTRSPVKELVLYVWKIHEAA